MKRKRILAVLLVGLFLFVISIVPQEIFARVILFPNGGQNPGEFGRFLSGARVALAGGAEAVWYNPAGMAKERRPVISVEGIGLMQEKSESGSGSDVILNPMTGNFSWVAGAGYGRDVWKNFNYGFFLSWPVFNHTASREESQSIVTQASIDPVLVGGVDLDSLFPGGMDYTIRFSGSGSLEVVSPGFGLGFEIVEGLRFGLTIVLEQVLFVEDSQRMSWVSAGDFSSANQLSAHSQSVTELQGKSQRLITTYGFQLDISRTLVAGISVRLPSESLGGEGSLRVNQSNRIMVTSSGTDIVNYSDMVVVDASHTPFQLRSPREIRGGMAFIFDELTLEVDIIKQFAQGSYEVFPQASSTDAASTAKTVAPIMTSNLAVTSYAIGMVVAGGEDFSYLFGYSRDRSSIPVDDPIFAPINLDTLSIGMNSKRGKVSSSFGAVYRTGQVSLAESQNWHGGTSGTQEFRFESIQVIGGFSFRF